MKVQMFDILSAGMNVFFGMVSVCVPSLILRLPADWRTNGSSCSSQLVQFQDFLLRANKYNCLQMVGDGEATERKLILVEVCATSRWVVHVLY